MLTTTTKTAISSPEFVKPKFIILEGVDRSGKDSMQDAIDRETRYKHFVMDRGPIGFKAYCEIFNKPRELYSEYSQFERVLSFIPDVLVIYLTASTEELERRCEVTGHENLPFDYHKDIYEYHLNLSPLKSITVDTTHQHVDEIVRELVKGGIL